MAERLLSVRGVKVPPGWVPGAIKMISEIVRRGVNRYIQETYGVEGAVLAEKSVYEAMSIYRQRGQFRQPNDCRQPRPRRRSKKFARRQ